MRKVCYHEHYVKCFYIGLDIWYPLTHAMQDSKLKFMVPFLDLLFYLFEGILCLLSQRKSEFKSLLKEWYFHSQLKSFNFSIKSFITVSPKYEFDEYSPTDFHTDQKIRISTSRHHQHLERYLSRSVRLVTPDILLPIQQYICLISPSRYRQKKFRKILCRTL